MHPGTPDCPAPTAADKSRLSAANVEDAGLEPDGRLIRVFETAARVIRRCLLSRPFMSRGAPARKSTGKCRLMTLCCAATGRRYPLDPFRMRELSLRIPHGELKQQRHETARDDRATLPAPSRITLMSRAPQEARLALRRLSTPGPRNSPGISPPLPPASAGTRSKAAPRGRSTVQARHQIATGEGGVAVRWACA